MAYIKAESQQTLYFYQVPEIQVIMQCTSELATDIHTMKILGKKKKMMKDLVGEKAFSSFGYVAAESDLVRYFGQK